VHKRVVCCWTNVFIQSELKGAMSDKQNPQRLAQVWHTYILPQTKDVRIPSIPSKITMLALSDWALARLLSVSAICSQKPMQSRRLPEQTQHRASCNTVLRPIIKHQGLTSPFSADKKDCAVLNGKAKVHVQTTGMHISHVPMWSIHSSWGHPHLAVQLM